MRRKSSTIALGSRLWAALPIMMLLLVAGVPKISAQGQSFLTGYVRDTSGAAVPNAPVTFKNLKTGIEYDTKTTEAGVYHSEVLPPGTYDVTVQVQGFATAILHGVEVEVGQPRDLDITLQVGAVTQAVEVKAQAPVLNTTDAGLGQQVQYKTVQDLPQFSRSAGMLLALAPGVRFTADDVISYGAARYNIGGNSNANVEVDGARIMGDRQDIAQMIINPSVETIQEAKVVLNSYAAEKGQDIGALVQYQTKSGTNNLHGSAYYYLRRTALDSYDGFTNTKNPDNQNIFGGTIGGKIVRNKLFYFGSVEAQRSTTPNAVLVTVPTPAEQMGDFSGLLGPALLENGNPVINPCDGTPILKGQIFDPATTKTVNGHECRTAFQGNMIPSGRFDPVAVNVKYYIPAPTISGVDVNNLPSSAGDSFHKIKGVEKADWDISDKDKFTFEWMFDHTNDIDLGIAAYNKIAPQMSPRNGEPGFIFFTQVFAWKEVHTISPTTFISSSFVWRPRRIERQNAGIDPAGMWAAKLGIKNYAGEMLPQLGGDLGTPGFNFTTTYTNVGSGFLQFKEDPIKVIDWNIDLTYVHGKHTLKTGYVLEFGRHDIPDQSFPTGSFTFSELATSQGATTRGGDAFASFLLGQVNNANTEIGPSVNNNGYYYAAYVQDDWKVRPSLTFNLGLRLDINPGLHVDNNLFNSFDFHTINPVSNTPGVILFANTPEYPYTSVWNTAYNWAPRFGFAWQPLPNTSIRGGYGIYTIAPYIGAQNGISTGFTTSATFGSPDGGIDPAFILQNGFPSYPLGGNPANLNNSYGAVPVGQTPSTSPAFLTRRWKFGYTQNANLSVQREIGWDTVLEVAGQAVLGRNLQITRDYNEVTPALWGLPGSNYVRRPFPQFLEVLSARQAQQGTTNYYGGYIRLNKRFSHGLAVIGSYNYGRTLGFIGGSIYYPQLSRGPVWYDLANGLGSAVPYQTFTVGWTYDLPWGLGTSHLNKGPAARILGGWNVGGLVVFQGGIPFDVSSGTDSLNGNSPLGGRVNVVGNPIPGSQNYSTWLNKPAFTAPAFGTIGQECCGKYLSPADKRLDLSIHKATNVKENMRITVAWEMFNATNTLQGGPPDSNLSSPTFGRVLGPAGLGAGIVRAPQFSGRVMQLGARFDF